MAAITCHAEMVRAVFYPQALLAFDISKRDGPERKLLDLTHLYDLRWEHRTPR